MARYTAEAKEQVRDATDFVALVGARTELRRAGPGRMSGRCPFHEERTPSFSVNVDQKLYYCFGCGAKGDVFTFVQETEGLDFVGALEWLADRAGIRLEREEEDPVAAERRQRRDRLLLLLERAAAFYERVLWESPEAADARAYLAGRGLGEPALRAYRVGYAPHGDRVVAGSLRAGFSAGEIAAAGLSGRTGRDRFFERVVFPLADRRGRVRGFGARRMGEEGAKYLNSPESEIFHKSDQLYAADLARAEAARASVVVLAEGYTDVIALHQAGVRNAVGVMGTSLTDHQVQELRWLASVVLLCLDADAAGQQAMLRAAAVGAGRGLEFRVVPMPPGDDPADVIARDGPDAMRALLERAISFPEFRVERVLAGADLASAEGRDRALAELRPILAALGPSVLHDRLLRRVADGLALPEHLAATLVARAPRGNGAPAAQRRLDPRARTERSFLALCIALPEHGEARLRGIDVDAMFTAPLHRRAALALRSHLADPSGTLAGDDPELAGLLAELDARAGALEEPDPTALHVEHLQLELLRLEREIAAARSAGGGLAELAAERQRLIGEMRHARHASR